MQSKFLQLGPKVLSTTIDNIMLYKLRDHANSLLTGPNSDYSSDLAGKNTHQYVLEYTVANNIGLDKFLLKAGQEYLNEVNTHEPLHILSAWVNICQHSDYNPIHEHTGLLSGVLYIDCPPSTSDTSNNNVPLTDGHTQFIFGQELRFSNALLTIYPKPGTLLLFPSWLMHTAYPSRSELNRTTISFNLGV